MLWVLWNESSPKELEACSLMLPACVYYFQFLWRKYSSLWLYFITAYHVRGSQDVVYKLTLKTALVLSGETLLIDESKCLCFVSYLLASSIQIDMWGLAKEGKQSPVTL